MSMFVALNSQQQLVTILEVARGLACTCTCVACGEVLIARQGTLNEHPFAHYSNKVSCEVGRETLLHLYGKQVIREAMGLQIPHLPDHAPEFGNLSSWWDFESVQEEVWLDNFRPDLVAHLRDGQRLLIEVAVTSFIDDEKRERINAAGLWALEIDLSCLLNGLEAIPSEAIRQQILHRVECKQWVYPEPVEAAVELEIPPVAPPSFGETRDGRVSLHHPRNVGDSTAVALRISGGALTRLQSPDQRSAQNHGIPIRWVLQASVSQLDLSVRDHSDTH